MLRSSLLRATAVYGAANVVQSIVPFLLVPLLTRHLTTADYGKTAVFTALTGILLPLVGLNLHGAVARKYFDRAQLDFPAFVFGCLALIAGCAAVATLALLLFGDAVSRLSDFDRPWLWTTVAVAFGQMSTLVTLALLQAQGKAYAYGALQIFRSTLVVGLTAWLVVAAGMDWRGSVSAQVLGAVLAGLVSLWVCLRGSWIKPRLDRDLLRQALRFGLPLVPHALAANLMVALDRLFVTHYSGMEQTGLYALGYQVGMVILLLQESFNTAWQPWLFEQLKSGGESVKPMIVRFTYSYFAVIGAAALLLGLVAPPVLSLLVSEQFQAAHVYVIWIAVAYAFGGMYKMVAAYLFFAERTAILSWVTVTSVALHAALNWVLVPRYGALGAAQATTAAFLASFLLTWAAAARAFPMPWLSVLRRSEP